MDTTKTADDDALLKGRKYIHDAKINLSLGNKIVASMFYSRGMWYLAIAADMTKDTAIKKSLKKEYAEASVSLAQILRPLSDDEKTVMAEEIKRIEIE